MNTTISKAKSAGAHDNLVFFTKDIKKFNASFFTPAETDYVKTEFTNESKLVVVNQYSRIIALHLIEKSPDKNKVLESCRKAGDKLTAILNQKKAASITLADDIYTDEILAFAEGMCLGNYQFLKYKKDKEKDAHTLREIKIVSKKIADKDVSLLNIICDATYHARDLVN